MDRRPMKQRKLPPIGAPQPPDVRPVDAGPAVLDVTPPQPVAQAKPPERDDHGRLKPGQKGINPTGTPEKSKAARALTDALNKLLVMDMTEFEAFRLKFDLTMAEHMAIGMIAGGKAGDLDMLKLVYERAEGKATQSLELKHTGQKDVHERVDDVTRDRINDLIAAGDLPPGEGDMDLPDDGAQGSQAADRESAMADEAAQTG